MEKITLTWKVILAEIWLFFLFYKLATIAKEESHWLTEKVQKIKSIVQEWIEVKEFDAKIWKMRYIILLMTFFKGIF